MRERTADVANVEGPQLELALKRRDKYHGRICAERLRDACRDVAERQGYKETAAELDDWFGDLGHPVSSSTLNNALNDKNGNHWRGEWVSYFAARSPEVAAIVRDASDVPMTDSEALRLLIQLGSEELGPAFKKLVKKQRMN